jgi:hypothetical protein
LQRKLVLAIHEDVAPGHEHIVEHNHRFLARKLSVADVDRAAFHAAGITGLASVDVCDSRRIDWEGRYDRVVLVGRAETHRRHRDDPMRVDATGLVRFSACEPDSVFVSLCDVHEEIGIFLLVWSLASVAFDVGHRAADEQVPVF